MRISSHGTVSGGPVFWLIALPFIAVYWTAYGIGWLLIRGGMAIVDRNAARGARKHLIPPR
jgi:hypothetical protein